MAKENYELNSASTTIKLVSNPNPTAPTEPLGIPPPQGPNTLSRVIHEISAAQGDSVGDKIFSNFFSIKLGTIIQRERRKSGDVSDNVVCGGPFGVGEIGRVAIQKNFLPPPLPFLDQKSKKI